jgi:hypothetical protein
VIPNRLVLSVLAGIASLTCVTGPIAAPIDISRAKESRALKDELLKTFTLHGKPVPPEVLGDMGDADMADSGSIRVTIDVRAAIGSNLYFDPIKVDGDWVTQTKLGAKDSGLREECAYRFVGLTANKLLVVIASFSGGGSGVFYTLHILDAQAARGFDLEGHRYDRLNLTMLRSVVLGDRWVGSVAIKGDEIAITTTGGLPAGVERQPTTKFIQAERP